MHRAKIASGGRFHREQRDHLKEMILNHVAQAACGLVKRTALSNSEALRERDLDAGHIVAIPDGLKKRVGKTEIENVHDRFLAQKVIDAEDRVFRKNRMCNLVQFLCRGKIAAKWLFDNHPCMLRQVRCAESPDHRFEERGRNRQVIRRSPRLAQRSFDRCKSGRILVVPAHILEQRQQALQRALVIHTAGSLDAIRNTPVQAIRTPLGECNADYRDRKNAALHHGIERRENHLVGEIAGDAEKNQRIGLRTGHAVPPPLPACICWRAPTAAAELNIDGSVPAGSATTTFPCSCGTARSTCWWNYREPILIHPPTRARE